MKRFFIFGLFLAFLAIPADAQIDEICKESGNTPSFDSPWDNIPYVYGKIKLVGLDQNQKFPNVLISLVGSRQEVERLSISKTGNYCFKPRSLGGTLILEIDGVEAIRRTLPTVSGKFREDFEINYSTLVAQTGSKPPGVISARFSHPENPNTIELYKKAADAENKKDEKESIRLLKEIVAIDPADFIAWAKLGLIFQQQKSFDEAIQMFKRSLEQKIEYTPAWINVAIIRMEQKQYLAAIAVLKQAEEFDDKSARIQQLLGENYLLNKQGTLGAEALNKAIELDPVGMAECHLKLAHLYQLAGANELAAKEYRIFLTKVPDHPDKKKFEKFIKKYPE